MSPRIRTFWALPLLVPMLMAPKCKKGPEPEPDVEEEVVEVAPVEVELQLTSIDPANGASGKTFDATLYGAGLESGAIVHFGGLQGQDPRVVDENTLRVRVPALDAGTYDVVVTNPGGVRATLRRGMRITSGVPDCAFLRLYFEYDQARLVTDAESAVDALMPCYLDTESMITVEGHTDERGTTSYNLALGQRRAATVEKYLTAHGVVASRLDTVSYGEEKPVDKGSNEVAWSKNRRVDIHVR